MFFNYRLILITGFLLISTILFGQNEISRKVIDRYLTQHNFFKTSDDVWGNYTLDLNIEAICEYADAAQDSSLFDVIKRFFVLRNYRQGNTVFYEKIPFSDPYFRFFELYPDLAFILPYVSESIRMKQNLPRTKEGAICIDHKGKSCMLIDYLQTYMIRMCRTGMLTKDTTFYKEAYDQLNVYASVLQYPDSKLFSQGRGWKLNRKKISPSAWSRGQGWLLRGIVTSMYYIPVHSVYYIKFRNFLNAYIDALLHVQDASGMWHTLPLLNNESLPEVSGTAMIAYYIKKSIEKGYVTGDEYDLAVKKATSAIKNYINPDYSIRNISKGPGPLVSVKEYKSEGELDNPHGTQAVILLYLTK